MKPFHIPSPAEIAPINVAPLVDALNLLHEFTPFAILNAVHACGLSVTEIGVTRLDALVDEARARKMEK